MKEKSKKDYIYSEEFNKYIESIDVNFYDFQLNSLAKKIKSACSKYKKAEINFINP